MRRLSETRRSASLLALVLATSIASATRAGAQEQHVLRGGEVSVFNLAGTVEMVPGSGSDVLVRVNRGGSDASRLDVSVVEVDGHPALVVRYPGDAVVYPAMGRRSRTQLRVKEDGTFSGGSSNTREVTISGSGRGVEAWADLRIEVPRGKEFGLYLGVGSVNAGGVDGDVTIDTGSGSIGVRDGSGELNLDTGSGSVAVTGFRGGVGIDTGSGGVELNDVDGEDVLVDTGSGSVRGTRLTARSISVDTGSGEIILREVSCPELSLDTGSGRVELGLLSDIDELLVDTGSGSVTIRAPSSLGAEVELDSGSGGIDLDLPLEVRQAKRDYLRGVMGDGRGSLRVETGSGAIRLIGG